MEQSIGRPFRQENGRSKQTCELTSSIVPRGTLFHRLVELEFPPIAFDPEQPLGRRSFSGPSEFSAINPDAMHNHGQPSSQCNDCLFHPAVPGDLHRPGLEPGPLRRTHQHALGRLVKHDPHHLISAPRYCTGSLVLARLILGGCESKHRDVRRPLAAFELLAGAARAWIVAARSRRFVELSQSFPRGATGKPVGMDVASRGGDPINKGPMACNGILVRLDQFLQPRPAALGAIEVDDLKPVGRASM